MNGKKCLGLSVLVVVGVAGAPAAASQVHVNPILQAAYSPASLNNTNTHSRHVYRLDGQQWEMFQRRAANINSDANDLSLVANTNDLRGVQMSYSLEFDTAKGFRFQMQEVGGTINGEVIWGDSAIDGGWNQMFTNTQQKTTVGSQDFDYRDFNSIKLDSSNMTFDGFSFASGVLGNADFIDGSAPQWLYLGRDSAEGLSFLDFNWSITGNVTANPGSPTPDFRLSLVQSEFAVIPLPTGAGLAGLGLGLVALRRRR